MIGTGNGSRQHGHRIGTRWQHAFVACTIAWIGIEIPTMLGAEKPVPTPALSAPAAIVSRPAPERESAVSSSSRKSTHTAKGEPQPLCDQEDTESLTQRFERLLSETQLRRSRKVVELRDQVRTLKGLLDRSAESGQTDTTVPEPAREPLDTADTAITQPLAPQPQPQSTATPSDMRKTVSSLGDGDPAVSNPSDRLALANNLFGAGDIELALELYDGLQKQVLGNAEKRWVRYQIATCHRRLGSMATAEQIYRELTSETGDDLISAHARWWLDAMGYRKRLAEGVEGLDQSIRNIERQIREPSND